MNTSKQGKNTETFYLLDSGDPLDSLIKYGKRYYDQADAFAMASCYKDCGIIKVTTTFVPASLCDTRG